jgi:hypothetical protein
MLSFQSPVVTPCDNPPATPFTKAELMPLIFIPPVIVPAAIFIPADVQVFALVILFVSYPSFPPSRCAPERRGFLTFINYYCIIDCFPTVILM